jgi:hypothetical protein
MGAKRNKFEDAALDGQTLSVSGTLGVSIWWWENGGGGAHRAGKVSFSMRNPAICGGGGSQARAETPKMPKP